MLKLASLQSEPNQIAQSNFMPDKFKRRTDSADALYLDVLCGNISAVQAAITETPELKIGPSLREHGAMVDAGAVQRTMSSKEPPTPMKSLTMNLDCGQFRSTSG